MTNQPICSAVVAMAPNHTIGGCNELLWHAPKDLKHFKSLTVDHAIIMGRKTFESIGRKLPRRHTIVVTSKPAWEMPDVEIAAGMQAALAAGRRYASQHQQREFFVVGGGEIYRQFMPYIQRIHLTKVDVDVSGDTYFYWPEQEFVARTGLFSLADDTNPNLHFLCLDRLDGLPLAPMPTYITAE
jgi:Dihydrofolate reductase